MTAFSEFDSNVFSKTVPFVYKHIYMNRLRGPHFFGQMEATVLAPDEIEEWQMLESWLHCQNGKITKAYIGLHPTQEPFKKQGLQLRWLGRWWTPKILRYQKDGHSWWTSALLNFLQAEDHEPSPRSTFFRPDGSNCLSSRRD